MRREPTRNRLAIIRLRHASQHFKEIADLSRIPRAASRVLDPDTIRLPFIVAAEPQEQQTQRTFGETAELPERWN